MKNVFKSIGHIKERCVYLKKKLLILGICIGVVFMIGAKMTKTAGANIIPDVIKPSVVSAYVPKGAVLYDNIDGNAVNLIYSGQRVEILKDRSGEWYFVKYKNKKGWVKRAALEIPKEAPVNTSVLADKVITDYANSNLLSDTEHFVWVDIDRQRIYVLKGENGNRTIEKRIVCATGKNETPTVRGTFKTGDKGEWFYTERLKSGAKYWVRFDGSYLFHSVAMDKDKNITDNVLGEKRSSGCVRMSVEDAKWFYENIEEGTSVWIY